MKPLYDLQFYCNGVPTLTALKQTYKNTRRLLSNCDNSITVSVVGPDGSITTGKAAIVLLKKFPKI